jgi:hypothetical protein
MTLLSTQSLIRESRAIPMAAQPEAHPATPVVAARMATQHPTIRTRAAAVEVTEVPVDSEAIPGVQIWLAADTVGLQSRARRT